MVTWIGGASAITFDNLRKQGEKSMESLAMYNELCRM